MADDTPVHPPGDRGGWKLFLVFLLLTLGIGSAGLWYQRQQTERNTRFWEDELLTVSFLKTRQIAAWLRERRGDASTISHTPFLNQGIEQFLRNPQSPGLRQNLQNWLKSVQDSYDYNGVCLLDANGTVRLSEGFPPGTLSEADRRLAMEVLGSQEIAISDLHRSGDDGSIALDLMAPVTTSRNGKTTAIAVVMLRNDPSRFIFPFIQFWPTPNLTAETLLVRREGDRVVHLTSLRRQVQPLLPLQVPISDRNNVAAMAVLGREGLVRGQDYHKVRVLAVNRHVPHTSWHLITKVAEGEIHRTIRRQTYLTFALTGTLIAVAGALVWSLWVRQSAQHARQRLLLEKRFEGLTRYATDMIITLDQTGRVIDANPRALRELGYSLGEIQGLRVEELHPPEEREEVARRMKQIDEEGSTVVEHLVVRKDRSLFPAEISAYQVKIGDQLYYQGIFRDLTERRKAEAALQASNLFSQTVISNAGEGIIVYDRELRYRVWNRFMEQITGVRESEILGKRPEDFFPHIREYGIDRLLKRALEGETVSSPETAFRVPSTGKSGWTSAVYTPHRDADGKLIGAIGIVRDITDYRQILETLRQSTNELRRTFDLSPVGTVMVDLQHRFLRCNEAFCRFLGYPEEELKGKTFLDVTYTDDRRLGADEIRALANGSIERVQLQKRYVRKDGRIVWGEVTIRILPDKDGKPSCFLTIIQDITERKQVEEALHESEALIRSISNNLVAGMIYQVIRRKDGTRQFTYLSDAVQRLYGISPREGMADANRIYGRVHPEDRARILEEEEAAYRGLSVFRSTVRMINPDGTMRWSSFVSSPRKMDDGSTCWDGIELDVTELKQAEESLRKAREHLEATLNALPDLLFETDRDGRIFDFRAPHPQLPSTSPEHFIGKTFSDVFPGKAAFVIAEAMAQAARQGFHSGATYPLKTPDGTSWFELSIARQGNPADAGCRFIVLVRNITERKQAEVSLLESEERFRNLFQYSPNMILIGDEHGRVIDANRLACVALGYRHDEILRMGVGELVKGHDREAARRLRETASESGGLLSVDSRCRRKDGTVFPAEVAATFINIKGKRYTLTIVRDITERQRLENEILQASEREQRRIGQDLHDSLSQNLTAIACLTKILAEKLEGRATDECAEAGRIGELIGEAITEARNLARGLHPVKLEAEGLMSALQELAAMVERLFQTACTFECRKPVFVTDNFKATHLYRIAQEAINNALKHSQATRIAIALSTADRQTTLSIRDNGRGLPDDLSAEGMGLRIMDYRARAIGASLQIRRDPGGGTVVTCAFANE